MSHPSPLVRDWSPPDPPRWWLAPEGAAFVGRVDEGALIEGLWESVLDGRRQVLLLGGDPGVGKSRVAAEACRLLLARGAAVLVGACLPDAPIAYEPFRESIVALAGAIQAESAADVAKARAKLGLLVRPDETAGEPSGPGRESFDTVTQVLRAASTGRPVVLVVEDLHWATPSTLDLLGWIIRRTPDARLLILMTARLAPPDRSELLARTLADLARERGMHRLVLKGLPVEDARRLVQGQLLGGDRGGIGARLAAQTGGNPFLLLELCRDLAGGDLMTQPADGDVHVPEAVRDLFVGRLSSLPEPLRPVVELAALVGDRVPVSLLQAVARAQDVLRAVEAAVGRGLLVREPRSGSVRFPHALARQAVVDATPPSRRALHHGSIADVLEARSGQSLPELSQLAYHTLHATGRTARARGYLEQCGRLAACSFAYLEAARLFERAADLADAAAERHRLQLLAADCLQSAGEYLAARDLGHRVVEETGDPGTRVAAASIMEEESSLIGGEHASLRALTEALGAAPLDLDSPECLAALAGLARALDQVAWSPMAPALSDAVLTRARATESTSLVVGVLRKRLQLTLGRPDRARAMLATAQELTLLARGVRRSQPLGSSGFFRCLLGMRLGDPDEVAAGVADFELAYDLSRVMWFGFWPEVAEVSLRFMRGDFRRAEELAWELRRWKEEDQGSSDMGHLGLAVFLVRRELGDLSAASELVGGDEDPHRLWAPGLLALYTELEMHDSARRVLDLMATPEALAANARTEYFATAVGFMVEAALLLHDATTLRRLRPTLAQHTGLVLVSEQFLAVTGTGDRYLGMVDSALGEGDPLASFDAAEELARRSGYVVEQALILAARAQHLVSTQGPSSSDVARCVAAARALAEPIGQRRVLRLLDRLPASTARRAGPHGLTERETEVLTLLGQGASNRQIARELTISEHTAANHVRAIMAKTGSANRTQAALLANQPGGSDSPVSSAASRSGSRPGR